MDVRIVELEPVRVASVLSYGTEPETMALNKLLTWASAHRLTSDQYRLFGFNNPGPSVGSPQYGYEVWLTVGDQVQSDGTVTIQEFAGGTYAVTRCVGVEHIPGTWADLVQWAERNGVQEGTHQWLEEHLRVGEGVPPEEMVLDLFMPVKA